MHEPAAQRDEDTAATRGELDADLLSTFLLVRLEIVTLLQPLLGIVSRRAPRFVAAIEHAHEQQVGSVGVLELDQLTSGTIDRAPVVHAQSSDRRIAGCDFDLRYVEFGLVFAGVPGGTLPPQMPSALIYLRELHLGRHTP